MSKYIIEIDENAVANGCYTIVGTNNVLVSPNGLDELEKYEEDTEETVKELDFPQLDDGYFVIYADGCVGHSIYENDDADFGRMEMGNCFRTEEEAKFEVERLKVLAEMKKFAEPFDTKWDGEKFHFYIYCDVNDKCLRVDGYTVARSGELYFKSEEKAWECVKAVGEDRIKKYYLGVE